VGRDGAHGGVDSSRRALVPALTVDTLLFEFAIVHQVILAT
jgi:hypothetical protein